MLLPVPIVGGKAGEAVVNRFSDAFSEFVRPAQTIFNAGAEAAADIIRAHSQVKVDKVKADGETQVLEVQRRGLLRLAQQEGVKQQNIEDVMEGAKPLLTETARPEDVDRDWKANFFDKVGLVSDEDMKVLWSRVLAGEVNEPGTFSKRTVNLLQELDKRDADAFLALCRFAVDYPNFPYCLVYDENDEIYKKANVEFDNIIDLVGLGLLGYTADTFYKHSSEESYSVDYDGKEFLLHLPADENYMFTSGQVTFTSAGDELALLCTPEPVPGFAEYLVAKWQEFGYTVEEVPPAEKEG